MPGKVQRHIVPETIATGKSLTKGIRVSNTTEHRGRSSVGRFPACLRFLMATRVGAETQ